MNRPAPPEKGAGDFAATSPKCFDLADHNAIVCSAQQSRGLRLRSLVRALRALQKPYGETFWGLEEFIGRIEDELERLAT